ncbi:hypothetical protein CFC21_033821 [Triticum aestivum]|uniref:Uncharacterized protein n=2 Tax=Triticum aestivum TaxID=4565 RepID=A0A3B6EA56_WHEAT|nr:hypothetical protein CFC21_033821 [Triticum aestivum]
MEGLLPFLYRAIVLHYAEGGGWRTATGDSPFLGSDSPSASRHYYVRLAGSADDSGRLQFAPSSLASRNALL